MAMAMALERRNLSVSPSSLFAPLSRFAFWAVRRGGRIWGSSRPSPGALYTPSLSSFPAAAASFNPRPGEPRHHARDMTPGA